MYCKFFGPPPWWKNHMYILHVHVMAILRLTCISPGIGGKVTCTFYLLHVLVIFRLTAIGPGRHGRVTCTFYMYVRTFYGNSSVNRHWSWKSHMYMYIVHGCNQHGKSHLDHWTISTNFQPEYYSGFKSL